MAVKTKVTGKADVKAPKHGNFDKFKKTTKNPTSTYRDTNCTFSPKILQQRMGNKATTLQLSQLNLTQRDSLEEDELIQAKLYASETPYQPDSHPNSKSLTNRLPSPLKGGLEELSGFDLSEVRVHANSVKPAQLNARAYAEGLDIHLGPGQEKYLPHEGWHVVQQMQGRVLPTPQSKGNSININDNEQLEREADLMGIRALERGKTIQPYSDSNNSQFGVESSIQISPFKENPTLQPENKETENGGTADKRNNNFLPATNKGLKLQHQTPQPEAVVQRWGELRDTPLVSPFFRGNSRFNAVLEDPSQLIQKGQEGAHVRKLQEALLELQYNLPASGVDGKFGPETEQAIRNFQQEAGAPEEAVDGIVGPDTLRELDQRFATAQRSQITSIVPSGARLQGNHYFFKVPIQRIMSEEEFLIKTIRRMFPVSDIEAHVLAGEGWGFRNHNPITDADVRRTFRHVSILISDYELISGETENRFSPTTSREEQDHFRENLESSLFNLTNTDEIYRLNQEIEEKRGALRSARRISIRDIDPNQKYRIITRLETELASLLRRRDEALERIGITPEIYEQQQQSFKDNFAQFAIQVARRMLQENEASVNVESTRYQNVSRVREVKEIFNELSSLYQQAQSEFNAGVDYEIEQFPPSARLRPEIRQIVNLEFVENFKWPHGRNGRNAHWDACWFFEQQAFERLQEAAQTYPILAHPGLEIRRNIHRYSAMELPALQSVLQEQLTDTNENISDIENRLNVQNVWELEAVIARAKYELGIVDDESVQAKVISDGIREARSQTTIRNLLLAAAGIGFGLLALASGPIGWMALGASVAVGSIDAYLTYQDISFTRAARRSAIDPSNSLTSLDASWIWFGVSLICIGIDVVAAVKIAKGIGVASRELRSAAELQEEAIRIVDSAAEVSEEAAEGVIQIANRTEIREILESQQAFDTIRIIASIEDNATAARLASALSENTDLLPALLRLEQVSSEAVQFYAGPGHRFLNQLPEVLRLSEVGDLASNPQLYEMLLTEPRMQRVLLDNADNPRLLLDDWDIWQRARTRVRDPVSSNFPEYLSRGLQRRTSVGRSRTLLTDIFDSGFHSLDNLNKNRQVLRQTAGNLVDAFNSGSLPPHIQDVLREVLNRDLIRTATDLETASNRVVRAINNAIGENVTDMTSYQQIMNLLEQSGSRGALGEAFAKLMNLIPGFRSAERISLTFGDVGIDVLNGRRIILDRYIAEGSIIGEIKVGSSFDRAQMLRLKALYENPDVLAEYFRAAGVQGDAFDEIIYMVMPGPSSLSRTTREYALTIYRALVREEMDLYSTVHYLDRDGVLWRIVSENSFEQVRSIN